MTAERARTLAEAAQATEQLVVAIKNALAVCDRAAGDGRTPLWPNLPEMLRVALEEVCHDEGVTSSWLVRHRPGSWEAAHVARLAESVDWEQDE